MIIGISGITSIGKTFCVRYIIENLGFKAVRTIRTREKRKDDNSLGLFISKSELKSLYENDEIAYSFDVFGSTYAYLKEDIYSKDNMVLEMHYTTIPDFKKLRKDIKIIYILPKDIKMVEKAIKDRCLNEKDMNIRTREIYEQIENVKNDKKIMKSFDYIIYNNYDENLINDIKNIINEIKRGKK
jgi:guanylate kinase